MDSPAIRTSGPGRGLRITKAWSRGVYHGAVNVLVLSTTALWPDHHQATLEICLRHLDQGDEVWLVTCKGALSVCAPNPYHDLSACARCRSASGASGKRINRPGLHRIALQLPHTEFEEPATAKGVIDFVYDDAPLGRLVASQLHDDTRDVYLSDDLVLSRGVGMLRDAVAFYEGSLAMISEWGIDVVVAWNGRHSHNGPLLYAGQKMGCEIQAHEIGRSQDSYLLVPSTKVHCRQFLEASAAQHIQSEANIRPQQELLDLGDSFFLNQRFGTEPFPGFVHFARDFVSYDEVNGQGSWDFAKRRLLVVTSSSWELAGMPDYEPRSCDFHDQYATLRRLLSDPAVLDRYSVVVRWHPNLITAGSNERAAAESVIADSASVTHIRPESPIDSYSLVSEADVVLGWASTLLAEATFMRRPAISLFPAEFDFAKCTYMPINYDALLDILAGDPATISVDRARTYGVWRMTRPNEDFVFTARSEHGQILVDGKPVGPWWQRWRNKTGYREAAEILSGIRRLMLARRPT